MRALKQSAGFILFAVLLEALWMLLGVDILEDLNIFEHRPVLLWLAAAVLLHALLAACSGRIRHPAAGHGVVFGTLAALLATGWFVPLLIGGDGLAVGMFQFLNCYWVLTVAVYFALLLIGKAGGLRKAPGRRPRD